MRHLYGVAALSLALVLSSPAARVFADEASDLEALDKKLEQVQSEQAKDKAHVKELAEAAEKYLGNNPQDAEQRNRAVAIALQCYELVEDSEKVIAVAEKFAAQLNDDFKPYAILAKGAAQARLGKFDDAKKSLKEMAGVSAEGVAEMASHIVGAVKDLTKRAALIEDLMKDADAGTKMALREAKGLLLAEQGKIDEARKVLDEIRKEDPEAGGELAHKILFAKGTVPPQFELNDLDGKARKLAEFKGKYVLLDFWATWCGPCRGLMKDHLAALHKKYEGKAFALVGIGCMWNDDTAEMQKKFAEENDYHWMKLFDAEGQVAKDYGVDGIPFLVLIDKDGKTVMAGSGYEIIEEVEKFLAENVK